MTVTSKVFFQADYVAASDQLIYQAESVTGKIETATATNSSATDATLTVYAVKSGETPSASNTVVSSQRVRPGDSYLLPELRGQTLEAGDGVYAMASVASSIVLRISGLEIV